MIDYLHPTVVANTIRLVKRLGGTRVALVEDPGDMKLVRNAIRENLYVISAFSPTNFVETVEILRSQDWQILFTSTKDLVYSTTAESGAIENVYLNAASNVEHKPTLLALTSSSAPRSRVSVLHELTESEVIGSPMDRQSQDFFAENSRRVWLIRKKYRQGLTLTEQEELSNLRGDLRQRLNAEHPISFQLFDAIDEYLKDVEPRRKKK